LLATGPTAGGGLVVDATTVYWSSEVDTSPGTGGDGAGGGGDGAGGSWSLATGDVRSVPICGGPVDVLAPMHAGYRLAVNAQGLYWTSGTTDATDATYGSAGSVWALPFGGSPIVLTTAAYAPLGIAVDEARIYWANYGDGLSWTPDISAVPIDGGPTVALVPAPSNAYDLAERGGHLYWTDFFTGTVRKVPIGGGTPTVLAELEYATSIAADDATVYVAGAHAGNSGIWTVPTGGGSLTLLAPDSDVCRMAIDEAAVYWTQCHLGSVLRIAKTGGTPQALAIGQASPGAIAVDSAYVYWANWGPSTGSFTQGSIMRIAK